MSFEATFESNENQNREVDNSFLLELNNEGDGSDFIRTVLSRNDDAIMKTADGITDHFLKAIARLPESYQKQVIDGFPKDLGPHDVVYNKMLEKFATA